MFLVTNVDGMAYLAAVGARFSSVIALVPSIIIGRHTMLLIADAFHMANASTEITNGFCSVNGNIFGFEIDIWSSIT